MAMFQTEFFGLIVYSPELTYEDLLAREEELKEVLQETMQNFQGAAINFEALGDSLRVQCMFAETGEDFFREFADELAPAIDEGLSGRLLFVDKDLKTLSIFGLDEGKWEEAMLDLDCGDDLFKVLS